MDDLISRAAAIEAALDGADEWDGGCNPSREEYIREHMAKVPAVDAVPVDWMKRIQDKCVADVIQVPMYVAIGWLIDMWQKEQEAHNEQINRR